ncbi:MAG TPA: DUF4418 family protein [Thermodesulfovibrionales bacterium]|nr:DUF4418 family protein [Thermodesulfovibrionales bacterium]
MRHWKFGAILFFMGFLVLLTPRYILPTCEYQGLTRMACTYTGTAEMFIGAIVMSAAVGIILSKDHGTLRWSCLTSLAAGISVLLVPEAIGYCHSSEHPCNYGTVPVLRLIGVLIVLLSLTGFFASFKRVGKE